MRSVPARLELLAVRASGWFSDWGRRVIRPMLFFSGVVLVFTCVYYELEASSARGHLGRSLIEALNVTLVAGYTAFFVSSDSLLRHCFQTGNLLLGLFWYSLIVPTITRKILR
jgi:hypothetical protein